MRKASKKGFTIIELVVVIAVIAILAAVLIPTFASLINKANESVDMQLVKQMNTVLTAEELTDGKPATVVDAQKVLSDNGIMQIKPVDESNVFYWIGTDNRVLLWEKDEDDPATGKVIYPSESKKKYSGVTTPSADWADLSVDYSQLAIPVTPVEGEAFHQTMLNAIKDAEDGAVIQLPANQTVDMQGIGFQLGNYLKASDDLGKSITIDLNGSMLDFTAPWSDNIHYSVTVPAQSTLEMVNGSINIQMDNSNEAAFVIKDGARIVLRNIDMVTNGAALFPGEAASEVIVDGCNITAANYAVGTNATSSAHIRVSITNSTLTATDNTAVLMNVTSGMTISNCTITGVTHAVVVRSGAVTIENSTLVATDDRPGIYSYKDFATGYSYQGWWKDGNTLPAATLVLGDYAKAGSGGVFDYSGDVTANLTNVTLKTADANEVPTVLMASSDPSKKVNLNYDNACTIGDVKVYGSDWTPTATNVGVTISFNLNTLYVNNQPAKLENNTTKIGE